MGASTDDTNGLITGINVTPLVDVVLVLLIIFMATAPLIARRAVAINVPQGGHGRARHRGPARLLRRRPDPAFGKNSLYARDPGGRAQGAVGSWNRN
jgi:hypothetical protein